MLFDNRERTFLGPIGAGETSYNYLDRSARAEVARIRDFLNSCTERYPASHRAELIARLKSDDRSHEAAIFELVVHEILIRAGHKILAVEPTLDHTSKSPDFLVEAATGERFYLECAVATGKSDAEAKAQRRLDEALVAANSVASPRHVLSLEVDGYPSEQVAISRLRQELAAWIAELPPSEESKGSAPYIFEQGGCSLRFTVWRFTNEVRPQEERSVGITSYGVHSSTPGGDLRSALLRKAKRYGELGAPYVVAVNTVQLRSLDKELFDALLGTPRVVFRKYADGRIETFDDRASDGVWTNGARPRKCGLSAVWSFDGLHPWSPAGRDVQLVRNPWATHPLPSIELFAKEWNPVEGEFKSAGENTTREALQLSAEWPDEA